ncbi:HAD family hydrolase [Demequina aurantiaca]|uniref:HAD family hydrolase n=1 Tax=Demequina aurantiaca TaxID=676200 RepID=UPI003D33205A
MDIAFEFDPSAPVLVALDIDDTCASQPLGAEVRAPGTVTPAVADALARARAAGIHVVFATGRQVTSAMWLARQERWGDVDLACSNGAVTIRTASDGQDFEVVARESFDARATIAALLAAHPDICYGVEDVGVGYAIGAPFAEGSVSGSHRPLTDGDAAAASALMVSCASAGGKELHATVEHLEIQTHAYTDLGIGWIDVAAPGVTKAYALESLHLKYDVPACNTVAVGDGTNDFPMFEWAGTAVAMGQAPDEVKAQADMVTGSIEADGVATVLDAVLAAASRPSSR